MIAGRPVILATQPELFLQFLEIQRKGRGSIVERGKGRVKKVGGVGLFHSLALVLGIFKVPPFKRCSIGWKGGTTWMFKGLAGKCSGL